MHQIKIYLTLYKIKFKVVETDLCTLHSGDSEDDVPAADRLCSAFKYSFCFVFLVVALLLVGAFVQFGDIPNFNGTIIDDLDSLGDQIKRKGSVLAYLT